MMLTKEITVYCDSNMKHINTLHKENVEFFLMVRVIP
jgi:hypothetical protein